jgi:hypothetical protein
MKACATFIYLIKNNNMKFKFLIAGISFILVNITSVNAQATHRAVNQHQRIKQGVQSGELTKSESRNLVKQEKEIRQDKIEAKSDGVITGSERREIRRDQNQASRSIYRKKHNLRERN